MIAPLNPLTGHPPISAKPVQKAGSLPNPPAATQFSGYHKDAVIGIDTKVVGVQAHQEDTNWLWQTLNKASYVLKPQDYKLRKPVPLILVREPGNAHDPNAVAVAVESDATRLLGHLPRELAWNIARLMDEGHQFEAVLTRIRPFKDKKDGQWYHTMDMRLEYVTKPGRAPNFNVMDQVEGAFFQAQYQQDRQKVLGLVPERITRTDLPNDRGPLVERFDHEQKTLTYYWKGHEMAKYRLSPKGGIPRQIFVRRSSLEKYPDIQEAIQNRLQEVSQQQNRLDRQA